MKAKNTTAVIAVSTLFLVMFSVAAGAVTERQKRDCKADYNRFCKKYQVGSEGLRACVIREV